MFNTSNFLGSLHQRIFLTFFDKRKSQKRCKIMLKSASERLIPAVLPFDISYLRVPDGAPYVLIMPVSASTFARFTM